jgi:hypothetical protein
MKDAQKQPPLFPRLQGSLVPGQILHQNSDVADAYAKFLWERVQRLLDYLDEMFSLHPSPIEATHSE